MDESDINRAAGGLFHILRASHKQQVQEARRRAAEAKLEPRFLDQMHLTRIERAISRVLVCNRKHDDLQYDLLREEYGLRGEIASNRVITVHPGTPGRVVTADRYLRVMTWGFPYSPKGRNGEPLKARPVNNARTDKLHTGFWKSSFVQRRCLIPMDRFAEAEGEKGSKTETWYRGPDPVLTAAGIWRESAEWGRVYSMVMTESAPPVSRIHDRMPVILGRESYATWLDGSPDEAFALCRPTPGLIEDRTDVRWTG